ncbi:MAG TPA: hypothetical protein PKC31_00885 [Candidatus Nanoperiomorbaceae bacterium]|nr:hypothetical protein [Candidatus Nanoperiomorbaceae bacterium]
MTTTHYYSPSDASVDAAITALIETGIAAAAAEHRVIDTDTARRIAACLHRGLGGELERFAGTGRIVHLHAARLELFYTARDEPGLQPWRDALKTYLHQRGHRGRSQKGGKGSGPVLPITPPPPGMRCDPDAAIAYLCTDPGDVVTRPGLALHMQHQACRAYVRHRLHRRLAAVFSDTPWSQGQGMKALLAHLAVCHNQQVVVHRIDRLPPDSPAGQRIAALGARVLSVTEHHTRRATSQAALGDDLKALNEAKEIR